MDYCVLIAKDFPVIKFELIRKWDENACMSRPNLHRKAMRCWCSHLLKWQRMGWVELLFKSLYFRVSKEAKMTCIIISTPWEAFQWKNGSGLTTADCKFHVCRRQNKGNILAGHLNMLSLCIWDYNAFLHFGKFNKCSPLWLAFDVASYDVSVKMVVTENSEHSPD